VNLGQINTPKRLNYSENLKSSMLLIQGNYLIMPRPVLQEGEMTLRAIGPEDIEFIRQWRNSQLDVLRQIAQISSAEQERYFSEHIWPDKLILHPKQILLAIEHKNQLIGYGGLVKIAWQDRRAEVSFLLSPTTENSPVDRAIIFSSFLRLVQELAFKDLGLVRLWTETYAHRTEHIHTLESAGFQFEGCLRSHVIINREPIDSLLHGILADEWNENHEEYRNE
jgi:RimJ/RimL family protein N-acetyltransferase